MWQRALISLGAQQFVHQRLRVINFSQRFDDGGGINGHGARLRIGVNTIQHERLNVAVENDADEFVCLVHYRAAAVAADDIRVGNEIERGREVECRFFVYPALWQIEWWP